MTSIINFIQSLTENYGLLGIGIGMFLESLGMPFGGLVVVAGAAPLVASGATTYPVIILVSAIGGTLGSLVSYFIGYLFGGAIRAAKKGKLVAHEERLNEFLKKYGDRAIFFAQLFGTTRSFVSLPAGITRFNIFHFIFDTFLGTLVIVTATVAFSPFAYKVWAEMSLILGVPIWISIILSFLFISYLVYVYKRLVKIIDENGEGK